MRLLPDGNYGSEDARYICLGRSVSSRPLFSVFWTDGKRYRVIISREMTKEEEIEDAFAAGLIGKRLRRALLRHQEGESLGHLRIMQRALEHTTFARARQLARSKEDAPDDCPEKDECAT